MLQRLVNRLRRRLFPSKAELLETSDLRRLAIFTGYARLGFPKDPGVEEVITTFIYIEREREREREKRKKRESEDLR